MAETIDAITLDWWDEHGVQRVRQLRKEVLSRGAWTTIVFAFQELERDGETWGPVKFRLARYQKRGGRFLPQSKFTFSSSKQVRQVIAALGHWLEELDGEE
ncbi:MAG: hypothetical protein WHT64_00150 [Desulfomicrobiaceae bacterium]